ncbi:MAG: hypothetical protein SynsKO_17870 [Synoicihabitans sp.]
MSAASTTTPDQLNVVSKVTARVVIALGSIVLLGWSTGQMSLVGIYPGWAATTPTTAVALLMMGIAVLGVRSGDHDQGRVKLDFSLTVGGAFIAILSLIQRLLDQNWSLNRWWFGLADTESGGLMSAATAWGLLFVSSGVLVSIFFAASRHWISSLFGLGAMAIGLTGVLDYVLQPDTLFGVPGFQTLAFPTAVGLLLLGVSLIGAAEQNSIRELADHPGFLGMEVKFLLPLLLVFPPILGWFVFVLGAQGVLSFRNGIVSAAVVYGVVAGYILWRTRQGFDSARSRQEASDKALQESERWAKLMVNSLPVSVWTCAPDGECDYLSPQWLEYSGIPEEQQLGFGWLEVVHPEDRERINREWMAAADSGKNLSTEYRLKRYDGAYRWFRALASPLRDARGGITKWFGSSLDIHSLKESRDQLAESHERLEDLVAVRTEEIERNRRELAQAQTVAKIGSWSLDRKTGEVKWSDELFNIFEMDASGGAPSYEESESLFTAESWKVLSETLPRSLEKGEGYSLILQILTKSGRQRWAETICEAIKDDAGATIGLAGTFQDVTESQKLRRQLEQTSLRLRLAMSAAKIGVWRCDLGSGVMTWDETMQQIYGHIGSEVSIKTWLSYVAEDDQESAERMLEQAISNSSEYDHSFSISGPEQQHPVRVRARADIFYDQHGNAVEMIGVNQDITAEWTSTEELRKREIELTRSNKDLQQFAYVASHDLQEPLRAISGCVQLLSQRYADRFDSNGEKLMEHTIGGVDRMRELINDLLAYSRVGSRDFMPTRISFEAPIRAALENLSTSIEELGAVISLPDAFPEAKMDLARLTQVFQNLFGNALKYRAKDKTPRIEVSFQNGPRRCEVSVADNGIGIEARHAKKIFEVFQRLHTRAEYPGSGIGLALCSRIIGRHGGQIWVETDTLSGSVFKFTLPTI